MLKVGQKRNHICPRFTVVSQRFAKDMVQDACDAGQRFAKGALRVPLLACASRPFIAFPILHGTERTDLFNIKKYYG